MNDNAELLKTLHRLRDQVDQAIRMAGLTNLKLDWSQIKTNPNLNFVIHDFVIGDFEIRDLRVSKVKCDKWCDRE